MRANGRVGGWFDARVVHTEHSYNYKLRATWLTPEVIRASARMIQLVEGMEELDVLLAYLLHQACRSELGELGTDAQDELRSGLGRLKR